MTRLRTTLTASAHRQHPTGDGFVLSNHPFRQLPVAQRTPQHHSAYLNQRTLTPSRCTSPPNVNFRHTEQHQALL
jgi:hypothetical protein